MQMHDRISKILSAIHQEAQRTFGDRLSDVILYGSFARGDFDNESDVDVMVLVDMDAASLNAYENQFSKLSSRLSLEDESCITVSLLLKDKPTFDRWYHVMPFYQNVLREGVRVSA